jgi:hypothetical protein
MRSVVSYPNGFGGQMIQVIIRPAPAGAGLGKGGAPGAPLSGKLYAVAASM